MLDRLTRHIEESILPPIEDDEFTIYDYLQAASKAGKQMTRKGAETLLSKLLNSGEVTMRKVIYNKRQSNAYKFTKP